MPKKNVTIKILLPILFAALAMLTIVQGVMALTTMATMKSQVDELAEQRLPRVQSANDLSIAFQSVRRGIADFILAETPEARQEAHRALSGYLTLRDETIAFIFGAITKPETAKRADELKALVGAENRYLDQIRNHVDADRVSDALKIYSNDMRPVFDKEIGMVEMLKAANVKTTKDTVAAGRKEYDRTSAFAYLILAVAVLATTALARFAYRRISRPITDITLAMNTLAAGDSSVNVPYGGRSDEIGAMASAVNVFKQNAQERLRLEQEAVANRSLSERERAAQEERKAQEALEVRTAVEALGDGLQAVASGDLTIHLDVPFAEHLDALRHNFNGSVSKLRMTLKTVEANASSINAGANEIRSAASDLSRRTEQQAASVEETAAALEQITTTVSDAARRAEHAGALVERTRQAAEKSGQVVTEAISAMNEIESSSDQISNIIGVIDDIAFQTNLLALNAGVEAARAGEAGKGFAVVAQEVRELAQRSAKAAKEIKELIMTSSEQVRSGVTLVGKTGSALKTIVQEVQEINQHVTAIVTAAREQSTGLREINAAVTTMDQGTQQNAAMVEQSTAASHGLAQQAAALDDLLSQFTLASETDHLRRVVASAQNLHMRAA